MPKIQQLRLAESVLLHDDGRGLLISIPPYRRLFEGDDRNCALSLIDKLASTVGSQVPTALVESEHRILNELVRCGVLSSCDSDASVGVQSTAAAHRALMHAEFGVFTIEVGGPVRYVGQAQAIEGILRWSSRNVLARTIRMRIRGVNLSGETQRLQETTAWFAESALQAGYHLDNLQVEVVGSLIEATTSVRELLDGQRVRVQAVIEDGTELGASVADVEMQEKAVADLSKDGFNCQVSFPTWCPEDLCGRVSRVLEANEYGGIRLSPMVLPLSSKNPRRPLRTEADLERCLRVFNDVTNLVSSIAHLCSPWREVLTFATTRPVARRGWSKQDATIAISDDGF